MLVSTANNRTQNPTFWFAQNLSYCRDMQLKHVSCFSCIQNYTRYSSRSFTKRDMTKAANTVAKTKNTTKMYHVSSSNTSVKPGSWPYTLFTIVSVCSYFFWELATILLASGENYRRTKCLEISRKIYRNFTKISSLVICLVDKLLYRSYKSILEDKVSLNLENICLLLISEKDVTVK